MLFICSLTFSTETQAQIYLTANPKSYIGNYNISCHGGHDGYITVYAEGGTPPYAFLWNPPVADAMTATIEGQTAGTYTCVVTDSLLVSDTIVVTLLEPDELTFSFHAESPTCHGEHDGSISAEVLGGTPAYLYEWASSGESEISELAAGNYELTVTDANGCTTNNNYNLTEPAALTIQLNSPVNANGFNVSPGESDGTIDLTVTGGTPEYEYSWSNGSNVEDLINRLQSGTYHISITDNHNCHARDSISLTSEDSLLQGSIPMTTRGNWMNQTTDYIGTRNAAALIVKTNNTEQMRIASDGNVGIGTTNPIQKLDITGNIKLRGKMQIDSLAFTPDSNDIALDTAGTQFFRVLGVSSSGVIGTAPHPVFDPSVNCNGQKPDPEWHLFQCDIVSNNNVGIGTYSPQAKLHVVGKSYFDGNVGIGTVDPQANLHIYGPSDQIFEIASSNSLASRTRILSVVSNGVAESQVQYKNQFSLIGDNIQRFIINSNGDIGIGTSPSYKLDVCGTIHSKEWVLEANWCDFKFESSSRRMTWKEKEAYLIKHKHLPEIDPGPEIENGGLLVGQTMRGFVWNIEDNTLDVIELQKQNEALVAKNLELERRLVVLENMLRHK